MELELGLGLKVVQCASFDISGFVGPDFDREPTDR